MSGQYLGDRRATIAARHVENVSNAMSYLQSPPS